MSTVAFVPVSRWLRRWWPILLLAGAATLVVAFVGLSWWIQAQALERGAAATREHPGGDEVEALIAYVDSDAHSLSERNGAVWALGQLRDPRALPVLEKYYTGEPCDHGRFLCQYELEKAIKLARGEGIGGWITNAVKLR